jgi:hypothetical protein
MKTQQTQHTQKTTEELVYAKEVANTIREQIKTLDPRAMWAWGVKQFAYSAKGLGSLNIVISGCTKVKGKAFVEITLMPNDTYTINVYKITSKYDTKTIKIVEDVYCDMLVDVIDDILG